MKTAIARGIAVIVALTPTWGCALLTKSDPINPRYFSPESTAASPESVGHAPRADIELRLGRVSAGAYLRERLVYRGSAHEIGYYDERRWTEKPETYVRRALEQALFARRGVRQVVSGASPSLAVEVRAFEEVRGAPHVGRVQLAFTLEDARTVRAARTVVVDRVVVRDEATKGDGDADAVVAAMAGALDEAVADVADAVVAELTAEAAAEAQAARPAQVAPR